MCLRATASTPKRCSTSARAACTSRWRRCGSDSKRNQRLRQRLTVAGRYRLAGLTRHDRAAGGQRTQLFRRHNVGFCVIHRSRQLETHIDAVGKQLHACQACRATYLPTPLLHDNGHAVITRSSDRADLAGRSGRGPPPTGRSEHVRVTLPDACRPARTPSPELANPAMRVACRSQPGDRSTSRRTSTALPADSSRRPVAASSGATQPSARSVAT